MNCLPTHEAVLVRGGPPGAGVVAAIGSGCLDPAASSLASVSISMAGFHALGLLWESEVISF